MPSFDNESPVALTRRARRINRELGETYPDAHTELDFGNALELSVATILSAQCTDKRVNEVTPTLFKKYRTAAEYAVADRAGTERGQDWVGGSVIVDQDGYPLTALHLGEEADIVATVDLSESRVKAISDNNDVHGDRRPDLYGHLTQPL